MGATRQQLAAQPNVFLIRCVTRAPGSASNSRHHNQHPNRNPATPERSQAQEMSSELAQRASLAMVVGSWAK